MMKFFKKHWEVLSYLIFGVLTTLLNILLYALFSRLFGYTAANSWGNVLDNALCILFAYCTNRAFVFRSKTTGKAMAKEFGTFVTCRLGTMVLDAAIMIVGGNLLAAQGAALMTDTTIERRFVDGLSDTVCNHALEKVLYDNFSQLGVPPCTAEEHAFMEALSATYEGRDVPGGVGAENDPAFAEKVKAMQTGHFNDFLMPLYQGPAFNAGSTDVGDVSYQCPTAQIHVAVWPNHVPCHSWQVVSCNKTPMAHKATVHAGKVLCAAAIDLLEQPALLEAAKAEFRQRTAAGYDCPIPADAVPAPLEL